MKPLSTLIGELADIAWEMGNKELSTELHELRRKARKTEESIAKIEKKDL